MSRIQLLLLLAVVLELAIGATLYFQRRNLPTPPAARTELFDQETARALQASRDAVRPEDAADWARLAEDYLAHGFYPEAEACHRRACELRPGDAELRGQWAFCLSRMGRLEDALEQFDRAIAQGHPTSANLHYFAGRDYLRLEDADAARSAFERAGDLPAARYELARMQVRDGKPENAVEILTSLQGEFPEAFAPHWLRAVAEQAAGRVAEAEKFAERAAAVSERLPTPFQAESDRILAAYRRIGLPLRWQRAKKLLEQQRWWEAARLLEAGLAIKWTPEGADLLSDAEFELGELETSRQLLGEIIERDGPTLHGLWRYGDACEALGDDKKAVLAWRHAVQLGPESEGKGLYVKLSQHHEKQGETAEAARWKSAFYCAAGVELLQAGSVKEAEASLQESLASNDANDRAWFYLAECQRLQDRAAAAQRSYRRCLHFNPGHGRAWQRVEAVNEKNP